MKDRPLSKDEGFLLYRAITAGSFHQYVLSAAEKKTRKDEEIQDGRTYQTIKQRT